MKHWSNRVLPAALAAGLLAGQGVAHAQAYPVKPIRYIIPFAPEIGRAHV